MTLVETIRTLVGAVRDLADPTVVQVRYPEHHPLAGGLAGLLVRRATGLGVSCYEAHKLVIEDPGAVVAELERCHSFEAVEDLAAYAAQAGMVGVAGMAFVETPVAGSPAVVRYLEPDRPERGSLTAAIDEHPRMAAWREIVGEGWVELTHSAFAELLLDYQEEVQTPGAVQAVSVFRVARKIEYDAGMDTAHAAGVRVSWGPTGDQSTASVGVPREIEFELPMWAVSYPRTTGARLRVRVVPSKERDSAAPMFRVLWLDRAEVERRMSEEAVSIVRQAMGPAGDPFVFRGVPHAIHRVAGHKR